MARKSSPKEKPEKGRSWKATLALYAVSMVITLGMAGALAILVLYAVFTPNSLEEANVWERTRVFGMSFVDSKGELLTRRGAFQSETIQISEMPPYLPAAFLAIEDRRFYQHKGLDPRGLARAIWVNFRAGRTIQGGSTITQQLAKNLFLSNDRTMARKFKEVFLTVWLEKHLTKDEILTLYLNRIYMGASTYGIDAAAQFYFGKSARDVSIAEAAMLAGLPKAPSRFAPTNNLASAQARSILVLDSLVETGVLTHGEAYASRANPAEPVKRETTDGQNYFVDYVSNRVLRILGSTGQNIKVYTTLDQNLQRLAEVAMSDVLATVEEDAKLGQSAIVSLDTRGAVRAMVGGKDYFDSQFNRAAQALRQPGSAFKPFVFLTALEMGIKTDSVWEDSPIQIGNWRPENYGNTYKGRVTMRQAFEESINTVAVQISQRVGTENVIERAKRLGVKSPLYANPSLALGTEEVNLLELTAAYIPFATSGFSADSHAILKIETEEGEVLYEYKKPDRERIIEKTVATDMNHLMYQVIHKGTGKRASLGNRPAAGKTGTSQDWRDAWFVGYTPNLVTGVWVGNDDASPMNRVVGGSVPAQIWKAFMLPAHQGKRVVQIPGGYPALDTAEAGELRDFLESLGNRFDKAATSRYRKRSTAGPGKKRKLFPWS